MTFYYAGINKSGPFYSTLKTVWTFSVPELSLTREVSKKSGPFSAAYMAKWTFSSLDDHLIMRVSAKKWTFLPSIWPSGLFLCQMTVLLCGYQQNSGPFTPAYGKVDLFFDR